MKRIKSSINYFLKKIKRRDDGNELAEFLHNLDMAILGLMRMIAVFVGVVFETETEKENRFKSKYKFDYYKQSAKNVDFSDGYAVTDFRFAPLFQNF